MTNANTNERKEGELNEDELGKVAGGLNVARKEDAKAQDPDNVRRDEGELSQDELGKVAGGIARFSEGRRGYRSEQGGARRREIRRPGEDALGRQLDHATGLRVGAFHLHWYIGDAQLRQPKQPSAMAADAHRQRPCSRQNGSRGVAGAMRRSTLCAKYCICWAS